MQQHFLNETYFVPVAVWKLGVSFGTIALDFGCAQRTCKQRWWKNRNAGGARRLHRSTMVPAANCDRSYEKLTDFTSTDTR